MLRVEKVSKHYANSEKGQITKAVDDVSLTLRPNEIFALIGESGSGKSTLAELIAGLQQPTSGSITWAEHIQAPKTDRPASFIQLVFQNPDRSMNPYWRVKDIISEPLRLSKYPKKKAYAKAKELLEKVMLSADFMDRYPAECSGGQKQRIAVARALSMSPLLLVADEITSALDPTIENEMLQLLLSLKRSEGMSILYITHRLDTISGFADHVAVMKNGVIQETGDTKTILSDPKSDYTKALLQSVYYT
ncbi:ABC transporter ATP-binding protein [Paenibacillus alba]|uniref:Dipeptide/oligopeptide/nickel ABC transporter ATP-binding protein n=1 Tax=Paenibacillus alba TaxID=1197127 RepID=A0ABU6FV49_9BACL|nr:dipeptide/oligopeptide/nickel ABC transporter ATP-binding protein [Paenibacillus alba]MEC0225758.1 dipeptide/oligopeptide/nickel ABC transporter ATP-binding protein [Paenibacillus alba]